MMHRKLVTGVVFLLALIWSALAQVSVSDGSGRGVQLTPATPPRPATSAPKPSAQILFIGNSLTYFNNMPTMLAAMFAARQQAVGLGQHTPGATSLQQHAANPAVAQAIAGRRWTHVVLQDQSAGPASMPDATLEAGTKLCAMTRKASATPVFFLTWGYPSAKPPGIDVQMQRALSKAYAAAAVETKALIAPVGPAWQAALEKYPKLPLYMTNDYHPAPEGSYLTACVLYTVIARQSPVGLPGTLTAVVNGQPQKLSNVMPERARFYQQVAWDTVRSFSAVQLLAQEARLNAALPTITDVRAKLKRSMSISEVSRALGVVPNQSNDVNRVYIFNLQNDTKLWITYDANGGMTGCHVHPRQGAPQEIALP